MDIEEFRARCLSLAGAHDDFPFGRSTSGYDRDILVFYVGDKWFCFVNAVVCDFCNLRCDPERIPELTERYEGIGPGWHMNKKHWISVRFGSDVPEKLLWELVDRSYELAVAHLTKKQRSELFEKEL
ncbi:MAG: MmcQ/YjbR family DNA-binding protein [Alistipes sp.]|nr:MmcQ/YjbR family DNA-binding protein [Alistipes sp.]MDE6623111.1 MmcQ/YjbR family DNA-binding protein [Alistipes sp.]